MNLFLTIFFLVYGGVHFYFYLKVRGGIHLSPGAPVILIFFLLLMVFAPLLVRLAERQGMEVAGRALAVGGYVWMGFLFIFCSMAVTLDMYRFLLYLAGKTLHVDFARYNLSSRGSFFAAFGWSCLVSVYGAFEARNIRLEHIQLATAKLPPGVQKFTIVQVSDVHLGLMVRHDRVSRMIELILKANPDVVVSTGDLVDGQLDGLTALAQLFRQVRPPCGKFAVTGNHEFYAGLGSSILLTREAGFRVLRNETVQVAPGVVLAGVDDPAAKRHGDPVATDEHGMLDRQLPENYVILLKHRPAVDRTSLGRFDLQLSGHVHKGQIFPFNLLTYLFYPVKAGLTYLPDASSLYVSRGTGTWGPPIRFLAPPEVTVIELISVPADK